MKMQPLNYQLEKSINDRYQTDLRRDMKQLMGVSDSLLKDYKQMKTEVENLKREVENLKKDKDSLMTSIK